MSAKPRTLYEKIWEAHVVERRDDGTCLIYIDRHLLHEVTSPQAFEALRIAGRKVRRPDLTLAVADHNLPTTPRVDAEQRLPITDPDSKIQLAELEKNVAEFGVPYIDAIAPEQGIVHVVGPEQGYSLPGATIVCGDSHTSAHGGMGALAFGIGTSEVEHVMATQTLQLTPSKTMEIRVDGELLGDGVTPKDVVLHIIGKIGAAGGNGSVIEYTGEAIRAMSIEGRLTVCNMSIEAGARAGLVAPDEVTFAYLDGRPMAPKGEAWDKAVAWWRTLATDPGAKYDRTVVIDAADIAPCLTWGTSPEDVVPITGVVPDPKSFADPAKQIAAQKSLDYMGLTPGHADGGRRRREYLHRQLHQQPDRGSARRRRGGEGPPDRPQYPSGADRAGLGAGQAPGRGRGARPHLRRGGLRMARAGLLDVPGDEPRQGPGRRTLRLDQQPQFRRPAGPQIAHPPRLSGDGGGGGGDRPSRRCPHAGARGMKPINRIEGRAFPLGLKNCDTDVIIPAHYLKTITRVGLGKGAFETIRREPGNVFDDLAYAGAPIIIAGDNFGCGSSREHAAWALADMGVQAVIAPSYSDIFSGNAFKNGILTVVLPQEAVDRLLEVAKTQPISINLDDQTVTTPFQDRSRASRSTRSASHCSAQRPRRGRG